MYTEQIVVDLEYTNLNLAQTKEEVCENIKRKVEKLTEDERNIGKVAEQPTRYAECGTQRTATC